MKDISNTTDLFSPVRMGAIELANRIVMAPVTRSRYGEAGIPTDLHATYYAQRATAGLIVAEATNISAQGRGYAATPGIWSEEQVAGWKKVTDAVHAAGGKIVSQLWHVGRFSSVDLQPNGEAPVGTRIRAGGMVERGSLQRSGDSLDVRFVVTDFQRSVTITYRGILPDLFREGQGIVALGTLNAAGVVQADEVLAKHDEKYMPPEVTKALKDSGRMEASP